MFFYLKDVCIIRTVKKSFMADLVWKSDARGSAGGIRSPFVASYLVVVGNSKAAVIGRLDRVAACDWLLCRTAGIQENQRWKSGSGFREALQVFSSQLFTLITVITLTVIGGLISYRE